MPGAVVLSLDATARQASLVCLCVLYPDLLHSMSCTVSAPLLHKVNLMTHVADIG